jgi:DNA-binding phage protein
MITSETYDIQDMSTKQLVDLRAWQTERLEAVTSELRSRVQAEYQDNKNIMSIAKKAGVTRRTVYAWVKE